MFLLEAPKIKTNPNAAPIKSGFGFDCCGGAMGNVRYAPLAYYLARRLAILCGYAACAVICHWHITPYGFESPFSIAKMDTNKGYPFFLVELRRFELLIS